MATILKFKGPSLNEMMNEFHRLYDVAQTSEKRANNSRIKAGLLLKDMRTRVENGECGDVGWWEWFDENSVRSREDAKKLLSLAGSDDPEEAHEQEKTRIRKAVRVLRNTQKRFPVKHIMKLVRKLADDDREDLFCQLRSEYQL